MTLRSPTWWLGSKLWRLNENEETGRGDSLGELGFRGNRLALGVIILPPKRLESRIRVLERSVGVGDFKCIICDPTKTYTKDESGEIKRLTEIEGEFLAVMMYDWDSPSWSEVRKEQEK